MGIYVLQQVLLSSPEAPRYHQPIQHPILVVVLGEKSTTWKNCFLSLSKVN